MPERAPQPPPSGPPWVPADRGPLVVVPLKSLAAAKGRLGAALGPVDRRSVAQEMFAHVVRTAWEAGAGRVVAVVGDPEGAAVARSSGAEVLTEPGGGLNAAVAHADVVLRSAASTLVVAADLPELTAAELVRIAAQPWVGATGPRPVPTVVVASTHDGGTGALLRCPPGVVAPAYGAGSAGRHLAAATRAGVRAVHLRLPGTSRDVDRPVDLWASRQRRAVPG